MFIFLHNINNILLKILIQKKFSKFINNSYKVKEIENKVNQIISQQINARKKILGENDLYKYLLNMLNSDQHNFSLEKYEFKLKRKIADGGFAFLRQLSKNLKLLFN